MKRLCALSVMVLVLSTTAGAFTGSTTSMAFHSFIDLPYRPGSLDARTRLDLYIPSYPDGRKPPLLLFIHGGAWITGDKKWVRTIGQTLASEGIGVTCISYRLCSDGKTHHPLPTQDGAAAFHWLRTHAAEYGYDTDRIFIGGHSAGAHMTALLGLDPTYLAQAGESVESVAGFIPIAGIYDIPRLVERWPRYRSDFIEAAFGKDEEGWKKASPVFLRLSKESETSQPWLVISSAGDELVDTVQSDTFISFLEKNHRPVRPLRFLQKTHFQQVADLADEKDPLNAAVVDFIRSHSSHP